jgi:hypothetical protein
MDSNYGGQLHEASARLLDQVLKNGPPDRLTFDDEGEPDWEELNKFDPPIETIHDASPIDLPDAQKRLTKLSDIVENMLTVDGAPFSFDGRTYLKGLYDPVKEYPIGCRNQLWLAGRQVEKSTSQSAKSAALGIAYTAFKTLYVAPRFDQVTVFSQQRFKPMCEDSVQLKDRWCKPSKTLWQVGAKQFANGSFFNFRSCYLSADGARGISAHHLMIDEIQDIVSDNIAVLEQCQSHAQNDLKYNSYAGTPKTNSNVITRRWENTCQFEWLVRCSCSYWNYIDDRIVGEDFYECTRCHKEIDPHTQGQWVPAKPALLNKCWGFRISQIMVPFKTHADIRAIRDDPQVSRQKYYNECLGLPYDEGELALTRRDMEAACAIGDGQGMWSPQKCVSAAAKGIIFFAGVDYGSGESDSSSFTILTIGFRHPRTHRFQVVYIKKFVGDDTSLAKQPRIIHDICSAYQVQWLGADWGFGAALNQRLVEEYGWGRESGAHLLLEYQSVVQKLKAVYSRKGGRYTIDRTTCMTDLIDAIRTGKVSFFRQEEMEKYFSEFTSIFSEFNEKTGIMRYDHSMPDDGFHSLNYAFMTCKQFYGSFVPTSLPSLPR